MSDRHLGVGIDLVRISRIQESLTAFGDRFLRRIFTEDEVSYAMEAPALAAERLAARFAAKEATLKALGLVDHSMKWRDIEVRRAASGACEISLRGSAGTFAENHGVRELALSLSHEGDYATAIVIASMSVSPPR